MTEALRWLGLFATLAAARAVWLRWLHVWRPRVVAWCDTDPFARLARRRGWL